MSQPNETVPVDGLRKPLADFAVQCERKLRKNDHKTEWKQLPVEALVRKLEIELEEMKVALQYEGPQNAMNECVDIANFAMMLWDRLQQPAAFMVPKSVFRDFPSAKPGELVQVEIEQMTVGPRFKYTPLPATHLMPSDDGSAPVAEEPAYTGTWTRHGSWMDGNREVAKMYRNTPAGGGCVMYYEDVPEVRARGLRVVPEHIAKHLEAEGSRV